ncbi:xylulokinase [Nakamurella lactea]|uniref:xylulokinase n=1 Tax=Nakamurella lactea TaxID=459515 RepID=UPI0004026F4A|nr:FGGY family carbohydrate kinase [Nakamurella lactea]
MTVRVDGALLGIDLGTSSVKVVLVELGGSTLATAVVDYPVQRPRTRWAETDPALWWAAVVDAVGRVRAQSDRMPIGIGLSGQMHGVVVCDASGKPLRPAMLWSDSRAEPQLTIYRDLPTATRARLGNPLSPGMAGPLLAWLAVEEPETMRRAKWALQPKDWIRARLTGEFRSEPSDASATLLYDLVGRRWDGEVIEALGLDPALFAPLLTCSGDRAGELLGSAAAELGLPAGLVVAAGAADTAAAALGSGLTEIGCLQLTIGTGAQLITPVAAPTLDALSAAGEPTTHTYRAATANGWYAMAAVLNGGSALDWVRRTLDVSWAELYAAVDDDPEPDDEGPIFLPYLAGERTPHLDTSLTASWIGLTGRHLRRDLLRAALEGVAFAIADARDALPGTASTAAAIRLGGGGSLAAGWRQLLADVLGARLDALEVPGASASGAALTGALAADLIDEGSLIGSVQPSVTPVARPRAAFTDRYRQRRQEAHRLLTAVRGTRSPGPGSDVRPV